MTSLKKNGKPFHAVVRSEQFNPGVWDPSEYQRTKNGSTLGDFATVHKVTTKKFPSVSSKFKPIEYRSIPGSPFFTYKLTHSPPGYLKSKLPAVEEETILFGTMRAYLANVTITPLAIWIDEKPPAHYLVKSEFVAIYPHDKLKYYWLAFLRSRPFIDSLPLGSGGTRPRLQSSALARTSVSVHPRAVREQIDARIRAIAKAEWSNQIAALRTAGLLSDSERSQ